MTEDERKQLDTELQQAKLQQLAIENECSLLQKEKLSLEIAQQKQPFYKRRMMLELVVGAVLVVPVFGFLFKEFYLPFYQAENANLSLALSTRTRELAEEKRQFDVYKNEVRQTLNSQKNVNFEQLVNIQKGNRTLKEAQRRAENEARSLQKKFQTLETRYNSFLRQTSPSSDEARKYENIIAQAKESAQDLEKSIASLEDDRSIVSKRQSEIALALLKNSLSLRVRADPVKGSKSSQGHQNHNFFLSIDAPQRYMQDLASVKYFFDHPSFKEKRYTSSDPSNNFMVKYFGWGCLYNVTVKLETKSGQKVQVPFDMCEILGW